MSRWCFHFCLLSVNGCRVQVEKGGHYQLMPRYPNTSSEGSRGPWAQIVYSHPNDFAFIKMYARAVKLSFEYFFFLSNLSHFTFLCSRKAWAVFFLNEMWYWPRETSGFISFFWFTLYLRIYSEVKQTKPVPPLQNNPRESISVSSDLILLIPGARACFGNLRRRILINHSQKN